MSFIQSQRYADDFENQRFFKDLKDLFDFHVEAARYKVLFREEYEWSSEYSKLKAILDRCSERIPILENDRKMVQNLLLSKPREKDRAAYACAISEAVFQLSIDEQTCGFEIASEIGREVVSYL